MSKDADTTAHRKRIERLKKMILCLTALCIIIPIVICIILGIELKKTRDELKYTEDRYNVLITGDGSSDDAYSTQNVTVSKRTTETYVEGLLETDESISEKNTRKVYITFDDGPSSNTDRILDILDEYNVKATFFVVGKDDIETSEKEIDAILKEIPAYCDVYLMPLGGTRETLSYNAQSVIELCIKKGFKYSDRIHIRIWDSKPGV